MTNGAPAIATFGLGKRYAGSDIFAVKELDLNIMPGEVYGFLGPNGAGKSTTIRLLMNFIQPTEGKASIMGRDIVADSVAIKGSVGYLPGDVALYPKMTVRQFLAYMSDLQPPKRANYKLDLIKTFEVPAGQRIGSLSKGNRQKVGVIQAMMHEPEVLIMDEPTAGLDPLMQESFFELIRSTSARGTTVFFSSHNLSEVQKICDRVGFIREGKLIAEQKIGDFVKHAAQTYDIAFGAQAPLAELKRIKDVEVTANTPRHVTVRVRGDLGPLFNVLARHHVHSVDRRESGLEEEFLRFYRGDKG